MPLLVVLHTAGAVTEPNAALHVAAIAGLIGTLLPLVTGLITKKYANKVWATYLTLFLSVVTGAVTALTQNVIGGHVDWLMWVLGIGSAYVAAIAAYKGFHVPSGLAGAVQNVMPNVGLGTETSDPLALTSAPRTELVGATVIKGGLTPSASPAPVEGVEPKATPTRASGQPRKAPSARKKR